MEHLWMRAECRNAERRSGLTPEGAAELIALGMRITVEHSEHRVFPDQAYADHGCQMVNSGSWRNAPEDAVIFGLKELPEDGTPLVHRHIMFGHAFKGQGAGKALLARFQVGGGQLLDLEYLVDESGRRVAAFGYWAGFAGAAMAVKCWAAQQAGDLPGPQRTGAYADKDSLIAELEDDLAAGLANGGERPDLMVIGALGRVGTGATDLARALGLEVTGWDKDETASGGPFPEILEHSIFVNCILAMPGVPVFVGPEAIQSDRRLTVIADVACDPDSDYNPVPLYHEANSFTNPVQRVFAGQPVLDITAIDNLPSMLPLESSVDFAGQLLPHLRDLPQDNGGVWGRAKKVFEAHSG